MNFIRYKFGVFVAIVFQLFLLVENKLFFQVIFSNIIFQNFSEFRK